MAAPNFLLPPDTRVAGSGNPPLDMDAVVDCLLGNGAARNVLNSAYGTADPTGGNESATSLAFQTAINSLPAGGGDLTCPPGTWSVHGLNPVSGMRIHGSTYGATILQTSTAAMWNMDQTAGVGQLDGLEFDHLTMNQTGAFPIFNGAWLSRSSVHDCHLQANNNGAQIWNMVWATGLTSYMVSCRFYNNKEECTGAARTAEPWLLNAGNTGTLFQVNDCVWHDNQCFNNGHDTGFYWYHIIMSGNFGTSNHCNRFRDILFEYPTGGAIWLESAGYTTLENITVEDLAALTVPSTGLIRLSKNAGGQATFATVIRNYSRRGGSAANLVDIQLDATCSDTLIESPKQGNGGTVLTMQLGGSQLVTTRNVVPGAVVDSPATAAAQAGAGTSPPAPVATQGLDTLSGVVTWGTGTSPAAGNQVTVTYGCPQTNRTPTVQITPYNTNTANLGPAVVSPSGTGFTVATFTAPAASQGNTAFGFRWEAR